LSKLLIVALPWAKIVFYHDVFYPDPKSPACKTPVEIRQERGYPERTIYGVIKFRAEGAAAE